MLGIRRQNAGAGLCRALHEEIARANQAFLVGQRNRRTAIDRSQCRLESGGALTAAMTQSDGPRGSLDHGTFTRATFVLVPAKASFSSVRRAGSANGDKARVEFTGELGNPCTFELPSAPSDPVALARASYQVHRAVADRSGRTKHGDASQGGCRRGFVVTQWNCAHRAHQTIRARPTPSMPPRRNPKSAARTMPRRNHQGRSNSPPWPGIM